jgi:hypothetical protein
MVDTGKQFVGRRRYHKAEDRGLLDLVSETEQELADLYPRDRIDVQSFIWVVGGYREDTGSPRP